MGIDVHNLKGRRQPATFNQIAPVVKGSIVVHSEPRWRGGVISQAALVPQECPYILRGPRCKELGVQSPLLALQLYLIEEEVQIEGEDTHKQRSRQDFEPAIRADYGRRQVRRNPFRLTSR